MGPTGFRGCFGEICRLTGDVDGACQGHVGLPHSTEEGAVVNQPRDAVVHHDLPQVLVVQDV